MSKVFVRTNDTNKGTSCSDAESFDIAVQSIVRLAQDCSTATEAENILDNASDILEMVRIMLESKSINGTLVFKHMAAKNAEKGALTRNYKEV